MTNKAMASGYKDQALSIGIAGEQTNGQRYAVLGSNPFRTAQRFPDSSNAAMTQWLKKPRYLVVRWSYFKRGHRANGSVLLLS